MIVAQAAFVCSYTLTVRVTGIDRSHNHIGQTNPEDTKKKDAFKQAERIRYFHHNKVLWPFVITVLVHAAHVSCNFSLFPGLLCNAQ